MNATPFWAFRKPRTTQGSGAGVEVGSVVDNASYAVMEGRVGDDDPPSAMMGDSMTGEGVPGAESPLENVRGGGLSGGRARAEAVNGGGDGDWLKWDGTLPAPDGLFRFGSWYFDRMRDPRTVKSMLGAVYSNPGKAKG